MTDKTCPTSSPTLGWMEGDVHHYPLRVFFEDTDAAGIVYHANYLRFMERGRTTMTALLGVDHSEMFLSGGPFFVVRHIDLTYLKPGRLGDTLVVRTTFDSFKGPRAHIIQEIWRGDERLSQAKVLLVAVDSHGKPVKVPVKFRETVAPDMR